MTSRLPKLDPEYAYISSSLFLPRKHIEEGPVRSALIFGIDEDGLRVLVKDHPHHLEVPRAFLTREQLKELEIEVVDLRPKTYTPVSIRPKDFYQLRPSQVPAWAQLKDADSGVLVLSCGKGKTSMAWLKAAHEGGPVLFVSWQKSHLAAAESELRKLFDFDGSVGWIDSSRMEYDRDIVFCTIQTLAKRVRDGGLPPDFYSRFALAVYDECHHLSAEWFMLGSDVIQGKRLGLTATKNRVDRMEGIFLNHLGPIMYEDISQDISPTFYVVDTEIEVTEEDEKEFLDVTGQRNIPKIRSWLGRNEERNEVISRVLAIAMDRGLIPYALTHSVDQAGILHGNFPGSGLITGKVTNHETRLEQLALTPVFATMQIGAESYNREELDALLLLTPFAARDYAAPLFQQAVGRIQRMTETKTEAFVFLFLDRAIDESAGMTFSLIKEAKRQGFEVKQWNESTFRPRRMAS